MNTSTRLHTFCAALALVTTLLTFGGVEAMARHAAPGAVATSLAAKAAAAHQLAAKAGSIAQV